MHLLRRAISDLLTGRHAVTAAAASGNLLPASAAACWQHTCGYSSIKAEKEAQQVQPFSVALQQLEEAVTEQLLPPDMLASNRKALATLKEFAASLEPAQGYPPASVRKVQFVFRDPYSQGRLQRVQCQLKTTGGDCPHLVQQSLGQLLQRLGLPPHFYFDGDQFQLKAPPPRPRAPPRPRISSPATSAAASAVDSRVAALEALRGKAAAAGFPSQTISEQQFQEMEGQSEASRAEAKEAAEAKAAQLEKIKQLEPLIKAVACVPWLAAQKDAVSQDKVRMLKTQVVDELESWGWDLRGAVRRVWAGERHLPPLVQGKDPGTQLAIQAIVYHALRNDQKYGGLVRLDPE